MKAVLNYMKKDTVFTVALILAVLSAFLVHPSAAYMDYIDFRVLGILLSLMLVMEGFQANGVFAWIGARLVGNCSHSITLTAVLVFVCFFSAMILTNDVALITFVPFSVLTLKMVGEEERLCSVVAVQTVAANLGSMLTPMGNPQNLYLYGISNMNMLAFLGLVLPYTAVSGVLLLICVFCFKRKKLAPFKMQQEKRMGKALHTAVYTLLFFLCIATVLRLLPWYLVLLVVVVSVFVLDRGLLVKADYGLLLTFIALFVFIGNMGQLAAVRQFLKGWIGGRVFWVSVLTSQVISNVPAALLLSGFTENYKELIIGVNVGGLGSLIASMASLISYKQLVSAYPEKKGRYVITFTMFNILFLLALGMLHYMIR